MPPDGAREAPPCEPEPTARNAVLDTIAAHASVRSFTTEQVREVDIDAIIEAMRRAPTSSALQTSTFIVVTDAAQRRRLRSHAGNQTWVEECPLFVVGCIDLRRLDDAVARKRHVDRSGDLRLLISGTEDVAIALQNASLAARSLGYESVMIGGVLNGTREIAGLLGLPHRVIPLLGLCIGRSALPSQAPRPRLPRRVTVHRDSFSLSSEEEHALVAAHDAEIIASGFYRGRRIMADDIGLAHETLADDAYDWSEHVARKQARRWWLDATPKLRADLAALGWRGDGA
jgi:nitroreductase